MHLCSLVLSESQNACVTAAAIMCNISSRYDDGNRPDLEESLMAPRGLGASKDMSLYVYLQLVE